MPEFSFPWALPFLTEAAALRRRVFLVGLQLRRSRKSDTARLCGSCDRPLQECGRRMCEAHGTTGPENFLTHTVVPTPATETISNSSIRCFTPWSPRPRLPEVEQPPVARWISQMPGP